MGMSTALVTLPLLPGLMCPGAPVYHPKFGRGIMLDPTDPVNPAIFERVGRSIWSQQDLRDSPGTSLNLSADLGMDVAARWLAKQLGLTVGATAPEWRREMSYHEGERTHSWVLCVRLEWARDSWVCFHSEGEDTDGADKWVLASGISDITDPREALRLACLAIAAAMEAK